MFVESNSQTKQPNSNWHFHLPTDFFVEKLLRGHQVFEMEAVCRYIAVLMYLLRCCFRFMMTLFDCELFIRHNSQSVRPPSTVDAHLSLYYEQRIMCVSYLHRILLCVPEVTNIIYFMDPSTHYDVSIRPSQVFKALNFITTCFTGNNSA